MRVAVIGTGRVGLVTAACFAETGVAVTCVDADAARVRALRRGTIPFYETGLDEIVRRNRLERRLLFTPALARAVRDSAAVVIAVGAPEDRDGSSAVTTSVLDVSREVARAMNGYKVIAVRSTVPVGTAEKVREIVRRETTHPFSVVSNPACAAQGTAIDEFMRPDRVVVGAEDPRAQAMMLELYEPFTRSGGPVLLMDCASAEMAGSAAGGMLAMRLSFMNEVANLCERVGADVDHVRRAVGADRRIGPSFLCPGIGYGGDGLPHSVRILRRMSAGTGYDFKLLDAVEAVNALQAGRLFAMLEQHYGTLKGRTAGVWGLACRPGTDDMSEAPSIPLIEALLGAGMSVQAYDPEAHRAARGVFGSRVTYTAGSYDAVKGADALLIATAWRQFTRPDLARLRALMRSPVIVDGRNVFAPGQMRQHGFTYYSIGRA